MEGIDLILWRNLHGIYHNFVSSDNCRYLPSIGTDPIRSHYPLWTWSKTQTVPAARSLSLTEKGPLQSFVKLTCLIICNSIFSHCPMRLKKTSPQYHLPLFLAILNGCLVLPMPPARKLSQIFLPHPPWTASFSLQFFFRTSNKYLIIRPSWPLYAEFPFIFPTNIFPKPSNFAPLQPYQYLSSQWTLYLRNNKIPGSSDFYTTSELYLLTEVIPLPPQPPDHYRTIDPTYPLSLQKPFSWTTYILGNFWYLDLRMAPPLLFQVGMNKIFPCLPPPIGEVPLLDVQKSCFPKQPLVLFLGLSSENNSIAILVYPN